MGRYGKGSMGVKNPLEGRLRWEGWGPIGLSSRVSHNGYPKGVVQIYI